MDFSKDLMTSSASFLRTESTTNLMAKDLNLSNNTSNSGMELNIGLECILDDSDLDLDTALGLNENQTLNKLNRSRKFAQRSPYKYNNNADNYDLQWLSSYHAHTVKKLRRWGDTMETELRKNQDTDDTLSYQFQEYQDDHHFESKQFSFTNPFKTQYILNM